MAYTLTALIDLRLQEVLGNVTEFYSTVGVDNYYLLYTVKLQAYNNNGLGPMTAYASVYSAEGSKFHIQTYKLELVIIHYILSGMLY